MAVCRRHAAEHRTKLAVAARLTNNRREGAAGARGLHRRCHRPTFGARLLHQCRPTPHTNDLDRASERG
eukprot:365776-Chlamydomonas_euryale.AAC.3